MFRPRHRPRSVFCLLAMLLVVAGMVAQPVLATMGELHEISEHGGARHGHVSDQPASVIDTASDASGATNPPDPLHLLLHFAHCCGHASALFVPVASIPHPLPLRDMPMTENARAIAHAHLRGPFRPPITA